MVAEGFKKLLGKDMGIYIKKPILVEAYDFLETKFDEKRNNLFDSILEDEITGEHKYFINTLEGTMEIRPDDFVIFGIKGEKYPCKRDIFERTYDEAFPGEVRYIINPQNIYSRRQVMDMSMLLSPKGLDLIKLFEGLVLNPYLCSANKVTIGYGHLCRDGEEYLNGDLVNGIKERILKRNEYTQVDGYSVRYDRDIEIDVDTAQNLLEKDVARFERGVNRLIKVELTQNQFDALVSFAFNLGLGNLKDSTLRRELNLGKYENAAEEFHRWVYAGGVKNRGLIKRRKLEAELFLS